MVAGLLRMGNNTNLSTSEMYAACMARELSYPWLRACGL